MKAKSISDVDDMIYSTYPEFEYEYANVKEANTLKPKEQLLTIGLGKKKTDGNLTTTVTGFVGKRIDLIKIEQELQGACKTCGSSKMYDVTIDLLIKINPKKKILFSPGKIIKSDEFSLFKHRMLWVVTCYIGISPVISRQVFFDIYQARKKHFGKKDKVVKELLHYMEMARDSKWESHVQEMRESDRKLFEICKKADLKPYELGKQR